MRKRLLAILILVLSLVMMTTELRKKPQESIIPPQRTSHMLYFQSKFGFGMGLCTGTTIGPHSILTATHCDSMGTAVSLTLDLSMRRYAVLGTATDNRDHLIIFMDGPPMSNILPIEDLFSVPPIRDGEVVVFCGNGEARYPAKCIYGSVAPQTTKDDPSEIDKAQGMFYLTSIAIPGDSGSAIYRTDGKVIGLISYRMFGNTDARAAGFGLDFKLDALQFAHTFEEKDRKKISKFGKITKK
jgi:hypothetical protein